MLSLSSEANGLVETIREQLRNLKARMLSSMGGLEQGIDSLQLRFEELCSALHRGHNTSPPNHHLTVTRVLPAMHVPHVSPSGISSARASKVYIKPGNATGETEKSIVSTGLYVLVDSLCRILSADTGVVLLQTNDGLDEIASFGPHNKTFTKQLLNIVEATLRSGLVLQVPTDTFTNVLCIPIFSSITLACCAALLLFKKALPFSGAEEVLAAQTSIIVGQIVQGFGVPFSADLRFDPFWTLLHPGSETRAFIERTRKDLKGQSSGQLVPQRLKVLRADSLEHLQSHRSLPALDLTRLSMETVVPYVDYIKNVEECWRKSAEDLRTLEEIHIELSKDLRAKAKHLKDFQQRAKHFESLYASEKLKYEKLKAELSAVCGLTVEV